MRHFLTVSIELCNKSRPKNCLQNRGGRPGRDRRFKAGLSSQEDIQ